jgi:DNA-binding NarL/FixJ family response regulator
VIASNNSGVWNEAGASLGFSIAPAYYQTQWLAEHATDDTLSKREVDVLRLIAAGNANKQIADQLNITEDTVKGRIRNVLSKLGANDRTHAAMIGLQHGIIEL